jgi:hypothetical protein|nr:MAG TPA: hypothetical protein [Caudoviricetes sp.]
MREFQELKKNKDLLTKQQYRTIKGQIIAGDKKGAMVGLEKLLKKGKNNG